MLSHPTVHNTSTPRGVFVTPERGKKKLSSLSPLSLSLSHTPAGPSALETRTFVRKNVRTNAHTYPHICHCGGCLGGWLGGLGVWLCAGNCAACWPTPHFEGAAKNAEGAGKARRKHSARSGKPSVATCWPPQPIKTLRTLRVGYPGHETGKCSSVKTYSPCQSGRPNVSAPSWGARGGGGG